MYFSDFCFSISVPSLVQSILHSYGSCSHVAVSSLCSCVGSSNCLDASRCHSCISVVHPFRDREGVGSLIITQLRCMSQWNNSK